VCLLRSTIKLLSSSSSSRWRDTKIRGKYA